MIGRKGLTLIEVIVALAIFLVMVTLSFPILTNMGIINIHSRQKMNAQELGVFIAEEILFSAGKSRDKSELLSDDNLMNLIDTLQGLNNLELSDESRFIRDDSGEHVILETETIEISLEFSNQNNTISSNRVLISVTYAQQTFETLVWLVYQSS